jgi:undecaprenyl-diphosphatase
MLEVLEQIDVELFYFINLSLQNSFFDWFMPFITEKTHWFPVWGITIVLLLWKGGRQGRTVVLLVIPVIIMSDQLAAHIFKPLIGRIRPCVALTDVHLLVKMKTSFSLPSAHAANFFALATFFTHFYQRYKWWFFSTAFLVALSRVSVGVHYPFDIFAGAILGFVCALVVTGLWQYTKTKYFENSAPSKNEPV